MRVWWNETMALGRFNFSLLTMLLLAIAGLGASHAGPDSLPQRSIPRERSGDNTAEPMRVSPGVAPEAEQHVRYLWMEITAYCPCEHCCGAEASGVTASGLPVTHNHGRFVAADTRVLPFGANVSIPGYHAAAQVPVIDRGGAIKGNRLDVFFPTHEEALEWGRRWVLVSVMD